MPWVRLIKRILRAPFCIVQSVDFPQVTQHFPAVAVWLAVPR